MKKLIDVEGGMLTLLNEKVSILCCRYIYTGKLVGVNDTCIELEDPSIVYETGSWSNKEWLDVQTLPTKSLFIATASIESFGVLK